MLAEATALLAEHAVKAVRLYALGLNSVPQGKVVSPSKFLEGMGKSYTTGVADTFFAMDLEGIPVLLFPFPAWQGDCNGDVFLRADPATLVVQPGAESEASVICDVVDRDGEPVSVCPRSLLKRETAALASLGYEAKVAVEIESYVLAEPLPEVRAKGYRDLIPLGGETGFLYELRPGDFGDFLDAARRGLDGLGLPWESISDEWGPGQFEVNLSPTDPVAAADDVVRTKLGLQAAAHGKGWTVTFMPKIAKGWSPCGFHVNVSLWRDGRNVFAHGGDGYGGAMPEVMRRPLGGLMATLSGATSIVCPTINDYRRFAEEGSGAPTAATWGENNKIGVIRTTSGSGARIEHRLPSAAMNPYLGIAVLLAGVRAGLEEDLEPPPPFQGNAYALPPSWPRFPLSIMKAWEAFEADERLTSRMGEDFTRYWLATRRWEWLRFHTTGGDPDEAVSDWELARYFEFS